MNGDVLASTEESEPSPTTGLSAPCILIGAMDGTWASRPLSTNGELTVGRSIEADCRIDDKAVSRKHARLEVSDAGDVQVIDEGSTNGTLVGGKRIRGCSVIARPGDPIVIGGTVLMVHVSVQPERGPIPSPRPGARRASRERSRSLDELVAKAASGDFNVLLLGETGVGKGHFARRIHDGSARAKGPFIHVECAALSRELFESELFGHRKGAFTGADRDRMGLLEAADGGTIFLDEIGDMPMEQQAKLLVAIDQRAVRSVGASESTSIDVRIISATNRNLQVEISRDGFRRDLYHRVRGLPIPIPPLRDRRNELDGLISQFVAEVTMRLKRRRPVFDADAQTWLDRYDWPGNIRQLRDVIQVAVELAKDDTVTLDDVLLAAGHPDDDTQTTTEFVAPDPPDGVLSPLPGSVQEAERSRILNALYRNGGNQSRAARELGMTRNELMAKLDLYGIPRPRFKGDPSKDEPSKGGRS